MGSTISIISSFSRFFYDPCTLAIAKHLRPCSDDDALRFKAWGVKRKSDSRPVVITIICWISSTWCEDNRIRNRDCVKFFLKSEQALRWWQRKKAALLLGGSCEFMKGLANIGSSLLVPDFATRANFTVTKITWETVKSTVRQDAKPISGWMGHLEHAFVRPIRIPAWGRAAAARSRNRATRTGKKNLLLSLVLVLRRDESHLQW